MRAAYGESDGKWRGAYSTSDELQFIAHIGRGKWAKPQTAHKRRLRLEGYIATAKTRSNWGEVDRDECIAYAQRMLSER